jgi:hypothetical protein
MKFSSSLARAAAEGVGLTASVNRSQSQSRNEKPLKRKKPTISKIKVAYIDGIVRFAAPQPEKVLKQKNAGELHSSHWKKLRRVGEKSP